MVDGGGLVEGRAPAPSGIEGFRPAAHWIEHDTTAHDVLT